jgi:hypothetical protein
MVHYRSYETSDQRRVPCPDEPDRNQVDEAEPVVPLHAGGPEGVAKETKMDWLPIYSAPRGRRVLLWWPVAMVTHSCEEIVGGQEVISALSAIGIAGRYDAESGLFDFEGGSEFTEAPSHWRELPAPPPGTTRVPRQHTKFGI